MQNAYYSFQMRESHEQCETANFRKFHCGSPPCEWRVCGRVWCRLSTGVAHFLSFFFFISFHFICRSVSKVGDSLTVQGRQAPPWLSAPSPITLIPTPSPPAPWLTEKLHHSFGTLIDGDHLSLQKSVDGWDGWKVRYTNCCWGFHWAECSSAWLISMK